MATYNGSLYLREQIDSVLAQLTPADELVVADDGSTDDTPDILRSYGDQLRLVSTLRVGGVVANFERVLHHSSKHYVLLCDQDDVWLPGRLSVMRRLLAQHSLVMTNALITDDRLNPTGDTLFGLVRPRNGFWANIYRRSSFVGCCMGFRKSILDLALPFPVVSPWHDWLIGLLASLCGSVVFIDDPLLLYRRHGNNVSVTGGPSKNNFGKMAIIRIRILIAICLCLIRAPLIAARRIFTAY